MTMTSRALGMLGILSLVSTAACEARLSPDRPQSSTTPDATSVSGSNDAASIAGNVNAVAQDESSVYLASDDGNLRRVDKATMAVTILAAVPPDFVDGIAVDATDIYFTVLELDHGEVWRLPKSGGSPVTFATGFKHPQGIALDADTIYVADMGTFDVGASGNDGVIRAFPKAGGPAVVLAQGEQLPWPIALDDTGVIWGNTDWGAVNGAVRRVPKTGGAVTTLAANVDPGVLSVVDGSVYWQGELGIQTVPLTGGDVRTVTSHGAEGIGAFTADVTGAYFGDWGAESQGSVLYVPLLGGTPTEIAPASAEASDALTGATTFTIVDGCRLFAVEYDATYSQGEATVLHRLAKAGSSTTAPESRAACD